MKKKDNRIKCCLTIWIVGLSMHVFSQTVQKGLVVEINSGNKPLAGASVMAVGAIPTDSDGDGAFQLVFSKAKPGMQVVVTQIHKDGYELVNETDVKNWILSESQPFRIVLCKKGLIDISRRKFYDIGQDRYYALYMQVQKDLKKEKESSKITQNEYENALEEAMKEYERAMSRLSYYADKFSRINRDDLNETDAKALSLMEEGKVEEAIRVYEEAGILKKIGEKVSQRDTASYNAGVLASALEKELSLLKEKNDETSFIKADSIYRVLLLHDRESFAYNLDYALLLMEKNRYRECFQFLKQALLACCSESEKKKVEDSIRQFLAQTAGCEEAEEYEKQLQDVYMILKEKEEIENLKNIR